MIEIADVSILILEIGFALAAAIGAAAFGWAWKSHGEIVVLKEQNHAFKESVHELKRSVAEERVELKDAIRLVFEKLDRNSKDISEMRGMLNQHFKHGE